MRTRRQFLKHSAGIAGLASIPLWGRLLADEAPEGAPVRQITRGPGFHWFAYYDKLQFDPTGRFVLTNQVDFEHRSPTAEDRIRIGMVDLEENDRWIELGISRAWGWQQGCMLQWRPGSNDEILWNDRDGDRFVCHVLNVKTGARRTIPYPVYSVSPCGRWGVTPDFRRINDMRPGYGYAGLPDPYADEVAPEESGIWRVDLEGGEAQLILSLADIVQRPFAHGFGEGKHWFNHLLISPDGRRTIFLHRWRVGENRWQTRMFTVGLDGTGLREINPGSGMISHFIWRDPGHILAWAHHVSHGNAFYLFEDGDSGGVEAVGVGTMTRDGHCTYLPGNEWILNDSYPQGSDRHQELYVYRVADGRKITLGRFFSPPPYTGEWRCDLHPRFSPDGRFVTIDSTHTGQGRQVYLIDISQVTNT